MGKGAFDMFFMGLMLSLTCYLPKVSAAEFGEQQLAAVLAANPNMKFINPKISTENSPLSRLVVELFDQSSAKYDASPLPAERHSTAKSGLAKKTVSLSRTFPEGLNEGQAGTS